MDRESLKNTLTKDLHSDGKLSTRATNCCHAANLHSLYDIVTYFEEGRSFLEMRNAGRATSRELETLCKETLSQIGEPQKEILDSDFVHDYFIRHGHKPMFWVLEKKYTSDQERDLNIFSSSYPIFDNLPLRTEAELALSHGISVQRVNQIKNKMYRDTFSAHHPLIQEIIDEGSYTNRIKEKEVVWQDDERVSTIIQQENVHFTPKFILQALSALTGGTHVMLGELKHARKNKQWKNSVLLPKEPALAFNFERLVADVKHLISINLIGILSDFKSYILRSPAWLRYHDEILDDVIDVASSILKHEFGISTLTGEVVIPPSPVSQTRSPETKTIPLIHGTKPNAKEAEATQHAKEEIAPLADKTKPRGIRGAIVEFLEKHDAPQTIEAITNHVLRYFPGKKKEDIAITMYSDSKKRFARHGKGLFGLNSKNYTTASDEPVITVVTKKTFEERLADLEKFLTRNWHFPFSISPDQDESSLYRWWRLQRINKEQLPKAQQKEIERIAKQYEGLETDKKAHEWDSRFNTLLVFTLDNRRLPSPGSTGLEGFLHVWYKKTTRDYKTRRLTDEQVKKYHYIEKIVTQLPRP